MTNSNKMRERCKNLATWLLNMKDLFSAYPSPGNAGMKRALWAPCIHMWETSFGHGLNQVGKWEIY
jgi:hypothetical protein